MKKVKPLGHYGHQHVHRWMLQAEGGGKKIYACLCGETKTEMTKAAAAREEKKTQDPQADLFG